MKKELQWLREIPLVERTQYINELLLIEYSEAEDYDLWLLACERLNQLRTFLPDLMADIEWIFWHYFSEEYPFY